MTRDEITVLEVDMQLIRNQNSLRTWVRPTVIVRSKYSLLDQYISSIHVAH